jgi:hypothetical protein
MVAPGASLGKRDRYTNPAPEGGVRTAHEAVHEKKALNFSGTLRSVDIDPGAVYRLAFVKFENVSEELRAHLIH